LTNIPNPNTGSQEDSSMVKILTGILEDSVQVLKRIEKQIMEQNKIINNLINRVNTIETKFDNSFDNLTNSSIPSFEESISKKMETLETTTMDELNDLLNKLVNKLKKNLQLVAIQDLIENIDDLSLQIKGKKPVSVENTGEKTKNKPKEKEKSQPSVPSKIPPPKEGSTEKPEPIEEKDDEDHLVKPSSFFGS
jgi:DNA-binding protein H-NS